MEECGGPVNGAWTSESSALYPVTEPGRQCCCYSAEKCDLYPDSMGFPGGWGIKNSPANAGDAGSIPGLGRSPGGGNGDPLWYSCLRNPTDEEPGGLQSMGSQRVRHDWATARRHWLPGCKSPLTWAPIQVSVTFSDSNSRTQYLISLKFYIFQFPLSLSMASLKSHRFIG